MKIGYVRVSTAEQNTARQEEIMKQFGVEKVFIEKLSGRDLNRPQLLAMLDYVREGDVLMIESYSRLARSSKDLFDIIDQLKEKHVTFISHKENIDTNTPQGQLMLTIFAGLAQFERDCLLQRQREGIAIAKQHNKYKGRPAKPLEDFEKVYQAVKANEISLAYGSRLLDVSRATMYRRVKEYEAKQAKKQAADMEAAEAEPVPETK